MCADSKVQMQIYCNVLHACKYEPGEVCPSAPMIRRRKNQILDHLNQSRAPSTPGLSPCECRGNSNSYRARGRVHSGAGSVVLEHLTGHRAPAHNSQAPALLSHSLTVLECLLHRPDLDHGQE